MKQVGNDVLRQRSIAKTVAVEKTKMAGGRHAFSYPTSGVSGTSKRSWVEAEKKGPIIITRGIADIDAKT